MSSETPTNFTVHAHLTVQVVIGPKPTACSEKATTDTSTEPASAVVQTQHMYSQTTTTCSRP